MTTFYGARHRKLHDRFDSRDTSDVLAAVVVRPEIDDDAKTFIRTTNHY